MPHNNWEVTRIELLYHRQLKKRWILFEHTPLGHPNPHRKARFRTEMVELLDLVWSALKSANDKLNDKLEFADACPSSEDSYFAKNIRASDAFQNINQEQRRPLLEACKRSISKVWYGFNDASKDKLIRFIDCLLENDKDKNAGLNHSEMFELVSVLDLEEGWDLPALSVPNGASRKFAPPASEIQSTLNAFLKTSAWSTEFYGVRCSSKPTHAPAKPGSYENLLKSPLAIELAAAEFAGAASCIQTPLADFFDYAPKPADQDMDRYRLYAALYNPVSGPEDETFFIVYPLPVMGRVHLLNIYLKPTDSGTSPNVADLFQYWRLVHDQLGWPSCLGYIRRLIEHADTSFFRARFGDHLRNKPDRLPKTIQYVFKETIPDAIAVENVDFDFCDCLNCVPCPSIESELKPQAKIHEAYVRHMVNRLWQWALAYSMSNASAQLAIIQDPEAEQQSRYLEALRSALHTMPAATRKEIVHCLEPDGVGGLM